GAPVDLCSGADARDAGGGRGVCQASRRRPRLLRQAASRQRPALHLPLSLRRARARSRAGPCHATPTGCQWHASTRSDVMTTQFDVIIIGSGAGGGTLFHALAPTGKRILLLERGQYVPREKDNWSTRAVNLEGRYQTKEIWRDGQGGELHPHTNYWVGGNTKFYGAALFRLRREDFGEVKHHGGVSPAWPIGYDDMEPYYTRAEELYHVHGERGVDPTEPAASAPYSHLPVSHEPRIQQLADDFRRLGLHPFHVPLGIMLVQRNPLPSRCIRCETCDGHPCLVAAKSDAQVVCIDPTLERYPNVTLLTGAYVSRLETSPSGRQVTRVIVERDGAVETYAGD